MWLWRKSLTYAVYSSGRFNTFYLLRRSRVHIGAHSRDRRLQRQNVYYQNLIHDQSRTRHSERSGPWRKCGTSSSDGENADARCSWKAKAGRQGVWRARAIHTPKPRIQRCIRRSQLLSLSEDTSDRTSSDSRKWLNRQPPPQTAASWRRRQTPSVLTDSGHPPSPFNRSFSSPSRPARSRRLAARSTASNVPVVSFSIGLFKDEVKRGAFGTICDRLNVMSIEIPPLCPHRRKISLPDRPLLEHVHALAGARTRRDDR